MKKKILLIVMLMFSVMLSLKGVYAASASVSANKTSVTEGTKVTITVKVNAAAWNLSVSGSASDSIVGFNMDDVNETTTKTYTITPKKAGKYTVYLSGDITNAGSETANVINDSVTITVKEKPAQTTTNNTTNNTSTNTNKNTNTTANKNTNNNKNESTTATKKSSDANIAKLSLSVEGLSFNSSKTTYNITVGEDVDQISAAVTLSHSRATYTISGNKNLKAGNNTIKIVVTAEDGTQKTYKINVKKQGNIEETSSELSNLIIEDMTLDKMFTSTETEYVGSKMKYTESLNILPYTVSEKATYEIIGNENLKEGENIVTIKVTSWDKTNITEYKVRFEMMSKEETSALKVVNPYVEQSPQAKTDDGLKTFGELVMENSTIILLYLLALVEFGQVIYLYVQLKNADPNAVTVRRRNKK